MRILGVGGGPPPAARLGAGAAHARGGVAAGDGDARRRPRGGGPARGCSADAAGGERRLTDLRHVGQLLHAAASEEQLGPTALTAWLRTRIAEAEIDTADEERSRRLESDAEAVQVLTIHRSKGLEFPIVLPAVPVGAGLHPGQAAAAGVLSRSGRRRRAHHRRRAGGRRVRRAIASSSIREQRGEDLRLAYVALTRARHQAIVWWAGSFDSRDSPLGRLLFSRNDDGDIEPSGASTPGDTPGRRAGCDRSLPRPAATRR